MVCFSTKAATSTPVPAAARGAGLFQRLTSFLVGAGVMALVTQVYIYEEVKEGNKQMIQTQRELELRLQVLEEKQKKK